MIKWHRTINAPDLATVGLLETLPLHKKVLNRYLNEVCCEIVQNISVWLLCVWHSHSLPVCVNAMCEKPRLCPAQVSPVNASPGGCLQLVLPAEVIGWVWVLYSHNVLVVANSEFFTEFMRTHSCPWRTGNILWAMCHADFPVDLRTAPLARLCSSPPSLWIWVSLVVQRSQPSVLHDNYLRRIAIPLSLTWKLRWKATRELL